MNPDQKRLLEMFSRMRAAFPEWGFVVGVVELDNLVSWGWTNMVDPMPVIKHLAEGAMITVRDPGRN